MLALPAAAYRRRCCCPAAASTALRLLPKSGVQRCRRCYQLLGLL
jgi:hypothetical protein